MGPGRDSKKVNERPLEATGDFRSRQHDNAGTGEAHPPTRPPQLVPTTNPSVAAAPGAVAVPGIQDEVEGTVEYSLNPIPTVSAQVVNDDEDENEVQRLRAEIQLLLEHEQMRLEREQIQRELEQMRDLESKRSEEQVQMRKEIERLSALLQNVNEKQLDEAIIQQQTESISHDIESQDVRALCLADRRHGQHQRSLTVSHPIDLDTVTELFAEHEQRRKSISYQPHQGNCKRMGFTRNAAFPPSRRRKPGSIQRWKNSIKDDQRGSSSRRRQQPLDSKAMQGWTASMNGNLRERRVRRQRTLDNSDVDVRRVEI